MRRLREGFGIVLVLIVVSRAAPVAAHEEAFSLRRGDVGAQVALWQHMLNALTGSSRMPKPLLEDGIFGPATEKATRRFERDPGVRLPADGIVTTKERILWLGGFLTGSGAAKPNLSEGMRDARVGQLQVSLNVWISRNNVGLTPLWIDTVFGVRTAAAVRAFQSSAGLISDGIVGSRTWNELSKSGLLEFPPPDYP